jgi:hypothetical protein
VETSLAKLPRATSPVSERFHETVMAQLCGERCQHSSERLEKLATSDKATIVIERQTEQKCALRQGLG